MSRYQHINRQIDIYKRALRKTEAADDDTVKGACLECTVAAYGAREIIRCAMLDLGIRVESIRTGNNAVIMELEPGGMSDLLYEMLSK